MSWIAAAEAEARARGDEDHNEIADDDIWGGNGGGDEGGQGDDDERGGEGDFDLDRKERLREMEVQRARAYKAGFREGTLDDGMFHEDGRGDDYDSGEDAVVARAHQEVFNRAFTEAAFSSFRQSFRSSFALSVLAHCERGVVGAARGGGGGGRAVVAAAAAAAIARTPATATATAATAVEATATATATTKTTTPAELGALARQVAAAFKEATAEGKTKARLSIATDQEAQDDRLWRSLLDALGLTEDPSLRRRGGGGRRRQA